MNKLSYSEMIKYSSYEERLRYLKLNGVIGETTFGSHRYLNQQFYRSAEWKALRNRIILRDNGCDLACNEYPIPGHIIIHHINPITINNFEDALDPDNLVCVSLDTHNYIHYGYEHKNVPNEIDRKPNDTCPWK